MLVSNLLPGRHQLPVEDWYPGRHRLGRSDLQPQDVGESGRRAACEAIDPDIIQLYDEISRGRLRPVVERPPASCGSASHVATWGSPHGCGNGGHLRYDLTEPWYVGLRDVSRSLPQAGKIHAETCLAFSRSDDFSPCSIAILGAKFAEETLPIEDHGSWGPREKNKKEILLSQTFNVPLKIAFTSSFGDVKEYGMFDSLDVGFKLSSSCGRIVSPCAFPNGYRTNNDLVIGSKRHDSSSDAYLSCCFDRIAPQPRLYRKLKQHYNDASRILRIGATDHYNESCNTFNM